MLSRVKWPISHSEQELNSWLHHCFQDAQIYGLSHLGLIEVHTLTEIEHYKRSSIPAVLDFWGTKFEENAGRRTIKPLHTWKVRGVNRPRQAV